MANGDKTFLRITNKDIFNKLEAMHTDVVKVTAWTKTSKYLTTIIFSILTVVIGALIGLAGRIPIS